MYKTEKQKLIATYTQSALIKSVIFSMILALIIVAPFIVLAVNLLIIYIRFAYLYLFIIAILFSLSMVLMSTFFYATIKTYPKQKSEDINTAYLWKIESLIFGLGVFIISAILILIIAPTYII